MSAPRTLDRDAVLDELVALFRKRRGGCHVLLGVELASAGIALGLSQADIDEAQRRAEEPPDDGEYLGPEIGATLTQKAIGLVDESGGRTIAALFVDERGPYVNLPGVEVWGISRDARLYAGPHPVVAHPPCSRWCRLAGLVEARWGHKKGDDGGCFAAALEAVRRWGGVLEHPAYSGAWAAFDLPKPPTGGGWVRGICGGWSCRIDQSHFGHEAQKSTWLYAFGATYLPSLPWVRKRGSKWVGHMARRGDGTACIGPGMRLSKGRAAQTPTAFRDVLLSIARAARPARAS